MSEGHRGSAGQGVKSAQPGARESRHFRDLLPRSLSAVILIGIALGTAIYGGPAFNAVWWAAAVAINWEWQKLIGPERRRPRVLAGGVAISLAAPLVHLSALIPSVFIVAAGAILVATQAPRSLRFLAGFGVIYASALVIALELLRASFPFGLESIIWLFAVVWGTDVMAYFGGRLIGGPKLWPRLSPSKTWAGFLVGICSGALAGLAVAPAPGPYMIYVLLGLLAGAAAQGGDLLESMLKRRFGVKDSSQLIPGHGGVMDRLDGFTAAAVLAAALGVARFGFDAPAAGLFKW